MNIDIAPASSPLTARAPEWTIPVRRTARPQPKPSSDSLGFGKYITDHMFMAEHDAERGWHSASIQPQGPLHLHPASGVLHYGQAMFEGLKAFRRHDGRLALFRADFHCRRMAHGARRLCMPSPPEDLLLHAIEKLVHEDRDWVPSDRGCSLYIRPTLIGTEPSLGVKPARSHMLFIILSPVGAYYAEKLDPVRIWVEDEYVRASPGGLGAIKAGANYAASLMAATEAQKKGFTQVLWLDAIERRYLEEVGTMNVFFKIGDEIITPALSGTILGGATRDAVIHLLKDWGLNVRERQLSIDQLMHAHASGDLQEVFGTGTAAVISPVGQIAYKETSMTINGFRIGALTQRLYDHITGIQYGDVKDTFGWTKLIG